MSFSKLFFILFVLSVAAFADSPLCRILHSVAHGPQAQPDGFGDSKPWEDIENWMVGGDCSSFKSSYDFESGKMAWTNIASSITNIAFTSPYINRYVHANYNADTQSASIVAGVRFYLTAYHVSDPSKTFAVEGEMGFNVTYLPLALAGRYDPIWQGVMHTTSSGNLAIIDTDLFDGHIANVLLSRSTGFITTEILNKTDRILALAADANLRLVHFDAVPTVIGSDVSARLGFMRPSTLPASVSVNSYCQPDNDYSVLWNKAECYGSNCDSDIIETLTEFAAADSHCTNPVAIAQSAHASLKTTVHINSTSARLYAAHAVSKAVFRCSSSGEDGYISVSLEAISSDEISDSIIDVQTFLSDSKAAILMMKSGGFKVHGSRSGYVNVDGVIYSLNNDDMFGPGFGGVYFRDYPLTSDGKTQFISFVNAFVQKAGGSGLEQTSLDIVFSSSNASKIYDDYLDRSTLQTQYGLLSYFASIYKGISILKTSTNDAVVTLSLTIHENVTSPTLNNELDVKSKSQPFLEHAFESIKSRCGRKCRDFSNPPNMSKSSYNLPHTTVLVFGEIEITLKDSGLDSTCVPGSVDLFRSASFFSTVNFDKNDAIKSADIEYTTVPFSVTFSTIRTDNLEIIPNQVMFFSPNIGPMYDESITLSSLQNLLTYIKQIAYSVREQENNVHDSLRYIKGDSTTSYTLSNALISAANAVPLNGNSFTLFQSFIVPFRTALRSYLSGPDAPVGIVDIGLSEEQGVGVLNLTCVRTIAPTASGAHWCRNVDVTRAPVTIPLTHILTFQTRPLDSTTGQNTYTYTTVGSRSAHVSLPLRDQMRVGHVSLTTAQLNVNLPASANYTLNLNGKMERGNAVTGHFKTNMSLLLNNTEGSSYPYSFSYAESNNGRYNQGAKPEQVMSAFINALKTPQEISVHRLGAPLAPLAKAIREIVNLGDDIDEKAQWVYSITPYAVLAQSQTINTPTTQDYTQTVNFTVNNRAYGPCFIKVTKGSQWPQAVTGVATSLASCGDISKYISVDFRGVSTGQTGNSNDGEVVFYPRFPGSIYSFSMSTDDNNGDLFYSQSWHQAERVPDFLSWNDMYKLVYAAFLRSDGYKYSVPQFTTVSSQKLVPEAHRAFYPSTFNAVYFPAKTSITRHAKNVPLQTEFHSSEDSSVDGNGAVINIPEGSVVPDVEVNANVEMMFGVSFWCDPGAGTLTLGAGFDGSSPDRSLNSAVVPFAPNNTFVFTVNAERRSSTNPNAVPQILTWSKTITLTPGKLVSVALLNDVLGQLDLTLQKMVNITLDDDGIPSEKKLLMIVSSYIDGTNLYVPLKVEITNSHIIAVGSGSEAPVSIEAVTSCPITKDMIVGIDVKLNDYEEESKKVLKNIPCTGTVGILGLSHCKADVEGHHVISASNRRQDSMIHEMRGAIVNDEIFDEYYENGVDFDTSITLGDLAFDVSHNGLGSDLNKEKIVLSKIGTSPVVTSKDYSLSAFSARATTSILNGLLHTSQEDFCRGVEISQSATHTFVSKDEMNKNVPFTEQSLAPIYKTLVEKPFRSVHRALCEKRPLRETVTTTSEFCQAIKRHWAFVYDTAPTSVPDICGAITLNEEGLTLPLSLRFSDRHKLAPFYFDANRVSSRDVVFIGYGDEGSVDLVLDAEATFGIKFGFNGASNTERGPVTLDKSSSRMAISTRALPKDNIRTAAGSIVVDIDASDIQINTQIESEFTQDIEHNDEMIHDIYGWDVEDKSLLLRDGTNEILKAVVTGNAHLGALASNDETFGQCRMDINVPNVNEFYSPAPSMNIRGTRSDSVQYEGKCSGGKKNGGDFIQNVGDLPDFTTLANYFRSDNKMFSSQMIRNITKDLIDILVNDITDRAIGFLGKHIQDLTHKVFDDIVGDDVAQQISDDIQDIVENIIKKGQFPNATDLEREVLRVFSGYLNQIFKDYLKEPINTPDPTDPRYVWSMRFGKTKQLLVKDIDWSLGDHGYADLEFATGLTLTMDWTISFDVVWQKNKGVTIEWPVSPAFSASITADGAQLDLSGSLLFVTADLLGTFQASGQLSGNPFKKDITFTVQTSLNADGKLGLVGIIRQKTAAEKKNSLQTLPYVTAGIDASWSFIWGTSQTQPSTPKSWKFNNPQLCLGSMFTEFLQKATHEIDRVVKPLDPVFGKNGILLKPIPALTKLLGKTVNVLSLLELVCEIFSNQCNAKAVRTLVEVIGEIADDIDKLHQFEQWLQDPYGCADMMLVFQTFHVNWTSDHPTPIHGDSAGPFYEKGTLKFGSGIPDNQKTELTTYFNKWINGLNSYSVSDPSNSPSLRDGETEGSFGITLDILQDFPTKLMAILLGDNVAMMSVHFPKVTFSFSHDWEIPIYSTPYIAAVVGFTASVSFQPPTMIVTSKSLTDTIVTKNPSYIFRDIGIATNMSFVQGSIEVAGGLEGGINVVVFKAVVSFVVYLQFNAGAKVTSITGQDFETIDSLAIQMRQYGFYGLFDFELNLKAGVRIALQACVNVLFVQKCWTLLSWQIDTTLWDWRPAKEKIPDIAPYNAEIDGKHVDFVYNFDSDPLNGDPPPINLVNSTVRAGVDKPTYYIGVKSVMLLPKGGREANAALTKSIEGKQTVKWAAGTECSGSNGFKVIVAGESPRQNTIIPSCAKTDVEIVQNGYHEVTKFQISKTAVVPDSRPGVTLGSQGLSLFLSNPSFGVNYEFVGAPSYPVRLEGSSASKVSFKGSSSDYSASSVTLTAVVDRVDFNTVCDSFNYQSNQILCDNFRVITADGTKVYRSNHRL